MSETSKQQLDHWITVLEYQVKWIREAFNEERYGNVHSALKTSASMLMFDAIPTAKIVGEDNNDGV